MKKYVFSTMAFAAIVALASCNNAAPKMDEQPANEANGSESGIKIAYVEVDSLMTQYDFCKDFTLVLQKKSNNARNTLNQKGQQLQNAMNNFQQKLNNNGFASREQAESQQLPFSVNRMTCNSCRLAWKTNWPTRPKPIMTVFATVCSISLPLTTRIRNTILF